MPPSLFDDDAPQEEYAEDLPMTPLLLAHDDPALRQTLAGVLTLGGYAVTCVEDGLEALEQAQRGHFPVIVADIVLPRLGGMELMASLYEIDPHSECILLAEVSQLPQVIEAAEVGNVYTHFWKPLDNLGDLMRALARALERRELRLSNAHLLTDLRDTRSELTTLHARLEQLDKVAALGHMASGVAHEMETPLMGLLGYAKYLRARLERRDGEALTPEQVDKIIEYMQEMERSARRCYEAVQGIRDYTRVHDDPPGPASLHETLGEALELVRHSLDGDGIALRLNLASAPPPILANPRRLQQALLSLILNAQQAIGKRGGSITISTESVAGPDGSAHAMRLVVADDGPGIPAANLPRIFEPFFTTHTQADCLGLGLTIARNIVQSWKGEIRVESVVDRGTSVTLQLPVCSEMVVTPNLSEFLDMAVTEEGPDDHRKAA